MPNADQPFSFDQYLAAAASELAFGPDWFRLVEGEETETVATARPPAPWAE
jgi:hypothetical protein